MHESTQRNLEGEIASFQREAAKLRQAMSRVEKERDAQAAEAQQTTAKCVEAVQKTQMAEAQLADAKRRITDAEGRLAAQQALYEQVRGERNALGKSLLEAQDEMAESKRKLKIDAY